MRASAPRADVCSLQPAIPGLPKLTKNSSPTRPDADGGACGPLEAALQDAVNAPARRRGSPQGPRRRETFVARAVAGIVRQMARALPHLFRTTGFLALCLAAAAGLGCNSDDPISTLGPIDLTTTGEETTMIYVFTTGEPDLSTSTGEPPKPEATCRDALACLITCAINLPNPTPPEQDYGCFIDC